MEKSCTSERLVEEVIGCGPFQVVLFLFVTILTKVPTAATFMFMSFGNYNPGWRCLDNVTLNGHGAANVSMEYSPGHCDVFEACDNIEFNPDSSTIVTEWGLLCNRSWITSLIISIQMAGALIGSIVAGQFGDLFGRRTVVYGCLASLAVFNAASIFSTSWQMFSVFRFFLGAAASSMLTSYYVLTNEFLLQKWRGPVGAFPAWNVGTIIFGVIAFVVRDWKILHLATAILAVLCFLPVFWVPESLRWLAVKQKKKSFIATANRLIRMNKRSLPPLEILDEIVDNSQENTGKTKGYTVKDLFHPGFKLFTFLMTYLWMSFSIIYYCISFGVKNMYGDFYINLILLFALEMPFAVFPSFTPNLLGRKKGSAVFIFLSFLLILVVFGLQYWGTDVGKEVGSILLLLIKASTNSCWCIVILHTTEIYPTVVRGLSLGYGCLMARVGGIIAPFLIPDQPGAIYISNIVMATLALLCGIGIMKLPETKGKPLRDTFDESDEEEEAGVNI